VELLSSTSKQYKDRKKTLSTQVAALQAFLRQNPPPSRSLVQGGEEFVVGVGGAENDVAEQPKRLGRGRGQQ
jgi:hypothetical protein